MVDLGSCILAYYRKYSGDPCRVEQADLDKAAVDWQNNIIPPGFDRFITTAELLTLANEFRDNVCTPAPSGCPGGSGTVMLILLSPNGGESFQVGGSYWITWSSSGIALTESIKIHLFKAGSWVQTIAVTNNSDGYQWTVPGSLSVGNDYRIKIEQVSNTAINDISTNNFTIVVPSHIGCNSSTQKCETKFGGGGNTDNCASVGQSCGGSICTSNWQCEVGNTGYEYDVNNCGQPRRLNITGCSGSVIIPPVTKTDNTMLYLGIGALFLMMMK